MNSKYKERTLVCLCKYMAFSIHWYFICGTNRTGLQFKQLLQVSEVFPTQSHQKRKLLSTYSISPLGKGSVCKCESGFKEEYASRSITATTHTAKCSKKKLLEQFPCNTQGRAEGRKVGNEEVKLSLSVRVAEVGGSCSFSFLLYKLLLITLLNF